MAKFSIGVSVESADPGVEVTISPDAPLPVGRHRFQLVVVDDSGNSSLPDAVEIIVRDSKNPTAVITAPTQVEFGESFGLDGRKSSDVAPGRVVKYVWTLVE
jgi:hypothetical protein